MELIIILIGLYIAWKLFIDGWLFKIPVFIFGWIGMYMCLSIWVHESRSIAMTLGQSTTISWAAVIPTVICVLCLACTRE
jgi:hypothetical protein